MTLQYEEKFGVKVDIRIPEEIKGRILYQQWERWRNGDTKCYTKSENTSNLLTRYEHFTMGSGVGLPPDPFKPLALQHKGADLEAVIQARRRTFPPGTEYRHMLYPSVVANFEGLTGLRKFDHVLAAQYPEIDPQGRIKIPKIVAIYTHGGKKIEVEDSIIDQLQLPTSRNDLKLDDEIVVREVFDFENGYRIELVDSPE